MIPPDQYRYGSLKDWKLRARDESKPQIFNLAIAWIIIGLAALLGGSSIAALVIGIVATLKGTF